MASIYQSCIVLVNFIFCILKFAFACVLVYFMGNLLSLFCEIISYVLQQHLEDSSVLKKEDSFDL